MSQRGAISLPVVIAVVLGLGFGASAYLNYSQYQRAQQDKKLLKGEITDLRYQVEQDKLAGTTATPSPSPEASVSPSPTPTPSSSPEVAGASTAPKATTVKTPSNLHSAPSKSSSVLISYTQIAAGTPVTLGTDLRNGYQQVTIKGRTGYILASSLQN
jgi:uncharacterized protein YgiM (DUF1202 family)